MKREYLRNLARFVHGALLLAGIAVFLMLACCLTPYPWRLYHWLGCDPMKIQNPPDCIVVLGGGGIPSESGLMRSYLGAELGRRYPNATVIATMPVDGNSENSDAEKMRRELLMRGIPQERILLEKRGRNTREQALNVRSLLGVDYATNGLVIVTSPEHMRRAILSFRKAGFTSTGAASAYSEALDAELTYDTAELGGTDLPMPNVGENLYLRYQFWNNLGYLSKASRELVALLYYKVMRWI